MILYSQLSIISLILLLSSALCSIVYPLNQQKNIDYFISQSNFKYILLFMDVEDNLSQHTLKIMTDYCSKQQRLLCGRIQKSHLFFSQFLYFIPVSNDTSTLTIIKSNFQFGVCSQVILLNFNWYAQFYAVNILEQFYSSVRKGTIGESFNNNKGIQSKFKYANVVNLNQDNYQDYIRQNQFILVEFYSPDCGHCAKFAPIYDKIAQSFLTHKRSVIIGAVNINRQFQLSQKQKIDKLPTIRFFKKGKPIDYQGALNENSIIEFIDHNSENKDQIVDNQSNQL